MRASSARVSTHVSIYQASLIQGSGILGSRRQARAGVRVRVGIRVRVGLGVRVRVLAVQGAYSSLMNITLTIGEAQARELNVQLRARQSAGEPGVDLRTLPPP